MRLFIAIPLPAVFQEDLHKHLLPLQEAVRQEGSLVKWVRPPQFHLTLKFLGECRDEHMAVIADGIEKSTVQVPPFALEFETAGCFPLQGPPSVLWLAVGVNTQPVITLAAQLEKNLEALGFTAERRPFHAHLTLGRCKRVRRADWLRARLTEFSAKTLGAVPVTSVCLIRSILSSEGPDYQVLKTVPLKA